MHLFFFHEVSGKTLFLEGEEARHCVKVLRLKPGDTIFGTDGLGRFYEAEISQLGKESAQAEWRKVTENYGEKPQRVGLALSLLHKEDRFEWFVEKCAELGATDIFPFIGRNTVKTGFRAERMERILISAIKQCFRSRLPALHPVMEFPTLMRADFAHKFIAHAAAPKPVLDFADTLKSAPSVFAIVGPEGDFHPEELNAARQNGFEEVHLGANRLRAETAAIHLMSSFKIFMGY